MKALTLAAVFALAASVTSAQTLTLDPFTATGTAGTSLPVAKGATAGAATISSVGASSVTSGS